MTTSDTYGRATRLKASPESARKIFEGGITQIPDQNLIDHCGFGHVKDGIYGKVVEVPKSHMIEVLREGYQTLLANAGVQTVTLTSEETQSFNHKSRHDIVVFDTNQMGALADKQPAPREPRIRILDHGHPQPPEQ